MDIMEVIESMKRIWEARKKKVPSGQAIVQTGSPTQESSQSYSREEKAKYYKEVYEKVPLVTSIINVQCDQAIQDYYYEGSNKEKLLKWSDDINLTDAFYKIIKNKLIFGNAYVEIVKTGDKITKLKHIDPTWVDVYRDGVGRVIGYSQIINNKKINLWGTTGNSRIDMSFKKKIPNFDNIVHFKNNAIGSDKYGISIIEPLRGSIDSKVHMENNLGKLIEKYVAPLIWAKVGSDEMPAQDGVITDIASTLKNIHAESEIVTSHLVDLSVLDFSKKGMDIATPLLHVESQIITGGQVPPILLGRGEGTVDKAAEVQLRSFGRHIKSIQRELKIEYEDYIIVGQKLGNSEDKLIWTKAEEREWEADTDILRGLVTDGIITPQKANDLLPPKYNEKLPEIVNPMNGQDGEGGVQTPRPSQGKGADKVKDNPNNPQKTTMNKRSMGKRVDKDAKFDKRDNK